MRPETLRKRLDVLHQRAADAKPPAPVPVVVADLGESPADALKRAGVDPGRRHVLVQTVDASTPRPGRPKKT